jgi:hypothetical protein
MLRDDFGREVANLEQEQKNVLEELREEIEERNRESLATRTKSFIESETNNPKGGIRRSVVIDASNELEMAGVKDVVEAVVYPRFKSAETIIYPDGLLDNIADIVSVSDPDPDLSSESELTEYPFFPNPSAVSASPQKRTSQKRRN